MCELQNLSPECCRRCSSSLSKKRQSQSSQLPFEGWRKQSSTSTWQCLPLWRHSTATQTKNTDVVNFCYSFRRSIGSWAYTKVITITEWFIKLLYIVYCRVMGPDYNMRLILFSVIQLSSCKGIATFNYFWLHMNI